jgi:hypothetical protein
MVGFPFDKNKSPELEREGKPVPGKKDDRRLFSRSIASIVVSPSKCP